MIDLVADMLSRSALWAFALTCLVAIIRYSVVAGGAWLFLWRGGKSPFMAKRLRAGKPGPEQVRREVTYSLLTCVLFPTSVLCCVILAQFDLTRVYFYVSDFGWSYLVFSIVLMVFLHDALFYWTHRLLHLRPLMRRIHAIHHRSLDPTPWAAFAFHPLEGFLQVFNVVIIVLVIPAHPIALSIFLLLNVCANVYGHCGFEFFPARFRDNRLGRLLGSPSVHGWHHARGRNNYGLYFTFWDRVMGTWEPPAFETDRREDDQP